MQVMKIDNNIGITTPANRAGSLRKLLRGDWLGMAAGVGAGVGMAGL